MNSLSLTDYWMGRDEKYAEELTQEIIKNAHVTVEQIRAFVQIYEDDTGDTVSGWSSGWRPTTENIRAGGAPGSKHLTADAGDVKDPQQRLAKWMMTPKGIQALVDCGLWAEHPGWTPTWVHLQTVPPRSSPRVRVFIPSIKPPQTTIYGRSPVYFDV